MGLADNIRARALDAAKWALDSEDDVPFDEMSKALESGGLAEPTQEKPRALFHDPYSTMDWGGWRQRPSAMTYETLRSMAVSNTVIAAIIGIRTNQVAQFARPQQGVYDKGYRVILRDRRDTNRQMTDAEMKEASEIEAMIETTGVLLPDERASDRDSFEDFLKKGTRDILTYDQFCWEKIRDRTGKVSRFVALPSETIRPAVSDIEHMDPLQLRERVSHVQVYDNTIIAEFGVDDMAWCIMNPRSDLRVNGFGFSPLEQMVRLVTAWLYGFEYNCLAADTLVTTDKGRVPIAELDGTEFQVHDGIQWQKARAFATEVKPVVCTKLGNGLEIKSSPKHKFRAIRKESETGEAEWIRQHALKGGDVVLVNYMREDCPLDEELFHVGKIYEGTARGRSWVPTRALIEDVQFWEMIGFALGDGHWADPLGRSGLLSIFPHHTKDRDLFTRFLAVCERHGINAKQVQINKSHTRSTDGVQGYPAIHIHHKTFLMWLRDLGFRPSSEGKRIGHGMNQAPAFVRGALLRGLFSADGHTSTHVSGYRTPTLAVSNSVFRQDVLRCCWSVGVATNDVGTGWDRDLQLSVQDVPAFVEHIGYLQAYKNEGLRRSDKAATRWDVLHPAAAKHGCELVKSGSDWLALSLRDRGMVSKVLTAESGLSRPRLQRLLVQAGVAKEDWPEWIHYCHARVDVTDVEPIGHEPMFDVEVFSDKHLFTANGMATHNSRFFTQGSAIKGVLNIKGAIPDRQLRAFRRMWYSMVSGVQNAWKTPILNSEDIQWISMHANNREMEYGQWMDWITKITCAIYGIDPLEINFIFGSGSKGGSMFSSRPNAQEVIESKDKGLIPLTKFISTKLNHHLIWTLNPDFEFSFTGLDAKAENKERERRQLEVKAWKTVDEIRAEQDLDPLPDGKGDIILDPTYLQYVQGMQEEGGGEDNDLGAGEDDGSEDDHEENDADAFADDDDDGGDEDEGDFEESSKESLAASHNLSGVANELRKSYREHTVEGGTQKITIRGV